MIVTEKIQEIRSHRWAHPGRTWGLVPTMGALHAGHLSLVERARAENEAVAVSIFVNPTQFAPHEDLTTYPRTLAADLALLEAAGVDLVFTPTPQIMYPPGFQTRVEVSNLAKPLEGSSRPTHFAGVAVVVCKLFNIVQPTRAYFGQKDAQQTIVLKRMVADLNLNLELIVCPTARAEDGLALSSRNRNLTAEQRVAAAVLYRSLQEAAAAIAAGEISGAVIRQQMADRIAAEPLARLDYVSAADLNTLEELKFIDDGVLLSLAVFFGQTRLIDNVIVPAKKV